jgi:predicted branched-subunit amino acid permease
MPENNSFKMGLRDGIPIFLGYLSVSFAFGIFAVGAGLSIIEALLISMTNLTSAGQLAGVPIICSGGSFIELATSQLIINLRYSLMSVSLSQKLGTSVRLIDRFLISFGNTDEIFAVSASKRGTLGRKYFYGLILMPYIGWSGGTLLGAIAGNILPETVISALGIAIYGMFIAILVPEAKKRRATALSILAAAFLGCAFRYIPFLSGISAGFVIIICAVPISLVFALLAPIEADENTEGETL